jgi:nucleotide-binding universal stress UspA family protein
MVDQAESRRIVVGVDSSPGSKAALRWAMTQARLTGASVEAVAAWQDPAMYGYAYGWVPTEFDDTSIVTIAEKTLTATVAEVMAHEDHPVEVTTRLVQGPASQVLPAVAATALLLVVRQPRARRLRRHAARIGQPALRATRAVPRRGRTRIAHAGTVHSGGRVSWWSQ